MIEAEKKGLDRARQIYQDRPVRAQELKAAGKHIMGYYCLYPVLEIMTALDFVPYRITGNMHEPITKADSVLPTVVCPFIRSSLDLGLKGKYNFLDGAVMCHSCEVAEKSAHIWRTYLKPGFYFFIDTPHNVHKAAQRQMKAQLKDFQKSLEAYSGKTIAPEKLRNVIKLYNQQRALVRELYNLKKPDPPLISGTETTQVMAALMGLPVDEGIDLLKQVIAEVKTRTNTIEKKPRVMVWGSIIDDPAFIELIENGGANVVMDDTCVGSRAYFADVETTQDPMDGLAHRYLVDIRCPRTFREAVYGATKKDHIADLEARFGYLKDFAKDWNVKGVVLQSVKYCDIHGYEVPGLKDYLNHLGLPNVYVEWNYSESALAPLRTRIEAFLEVMG